MLRLVGRYQALKEGEYRCTIVISAAVSANACKRAFLVDWMGQMDEAGQMRLLVRIGELALGNHLYSAPLFGYDLPNRLERCQVP